MLLSAPLTTQPSASFRLPTPPGWQLLVELCGEIPMMAADGSAREALGAHAAALRALGRADAQAQLNSAEALERAHSLFGYLVSTYLQKPSHDGEGEDCNGGVRSAAATRDASVHVDYSVGGGGRSGGGGGGGGGDSGGIRRVSHDAERSDAKAAAKPSPAELSAATTTSATDTDTSGPAAAEPPPLLVAVLPNWLAVPYCAVARRLGRRPTLDYAACVLYNWDRVDRSGPIRCAMRCFERHHIASHRIASRRRRRRRREAAPVLSRLSVCRPKGSLALSRSLSPSRVSSPHFVHLPPRLLPCFRHPVSSRPGVVSMGNVRLLNRFTGLVDEEWFFKTHIVIESEAAEVVHALSRGVHALQGVRPDPEALLLSLRALEGALWRVARVCLPIMFERAEGQVRATHALHRRASHGPQRTRIHTRAHRHTRMHHSHEHTVQELLQVTPTLRNASAGGCCG
jgi:hypothetical protein